MREVAFIKQNKEKWLKFEKAIFNDDLKDPDALASEYIQIINDLRHPFLKIPIGLKTPFSAIYILLTLNPKLKKVFSFHPVINFIVLWLAT